MSVRLPARVDLLAHPAAAAGAAAQVSVALDLTADGGLRLAYTVRHDDHLRIPAPCPPGPADGLWAHTCGEAFITVAGEDGYREFNFSPSGQWAIYGFAAYRRRAENPAPAAAPHIACHAEADTLRLDVEIPPTALPTPVPGRPLLLGLTVVAEASDGRLQYWALRHPGEKPDFHDRRGFTLALALQPASRREHP